MNSTGKQHVKIWFILAVLFALILAAGCGDDENPVTTTPVTAEWSQVRSLPVRTAWWTIWGLSGSEIYVGGEYGDIQFGNGTTWHPTASGGITADTIFYSVWGTSTSDIYAVGMISDYNSGVELDTAGDTVFIDDTIPSILTWDEPYFAHSNGVAFVPEILDFDSAIFDIWGSNDSNIFVVGDGGRFARSVKDSITGILSWETLTQRGDVRLYGLWGSSDDDIYACGVGGAVVYLDAATGDLSVMRTPTSETLRDIWGWSDSSVFAVGAGGEIIHFDGTTWSRQASTVDNDLYSVFGLAPNDVYACGTNGTLVHYDGSDWTEIETGTEYLFLSIWGDTVTSEVYVVGQTALRSSGAEWEFFEIVDVPDFNDIWTASNVIGFAVGENMVIRKLSGGSLSGVTIDAALDTTISLQAVWGDSDEGTYFAAGENGTVVTASGINGVWSDMTTGLSADLYGLWGFDDQAVFTVGSGGTIASYNGTDWTEETSPVGADLHDLWGSADSVLVAVGDGGTIIRRSTAGTWTEDATDFSDNLNSVWGFSLTNVFAVGDGGTIVRYNGTTWTAMTSPTSENLTAVWGTANADTYAVGDNGTALHFDGTTWTVMDTDAKADFHAVYGVAGASPLVYAGGTFNHIYRYAQ